MFTAGPALFRFHGYTPKKDLHLHFLTYQAFKSREGIVFSKNSLWVTDQGILDFKKLTSIQTIWLIGVLEQAIKNTLVLLLVYVCYFQEW